MVQIDLASDGKRIVNKHECPCVHSPCHLILPVAKSRAFDRPTINNEPQRRHSIDSKQIRQSALAWSIVSTLIGLYRDLQSTRTTQQRKWKIALLQRARSMSASNAIAPIQQRSTRSDS